MSMFNIIRKEFQYGQYNVVLETGRVARQANSVLITMGGVSVLVAVVAQPTAKAGQDFFPLTVNYQEKQYAAGRIPGGYGKREGRASEAQLFHSHPQAHRMERYRRWTTSTSLRHTHRTS